MSRGRRGVLLVGLAMMLGGLAASDISRREAALAARLGRPVAVVVAGEALAAGTALEEPHLAVRRIPARYAPPGAARVPGEVLGGRLVAPVVEGAPVGPSLLAVEGAAPVRSGERAVPLVATGTAEMIAPGALVDVLVTREQGTELALRSAEVLSSAPVEGAPGGAPRVAVTLRVRLRQALALTEAEAFAREIRLLPRGAR